MTPQPNSPQTNTKAWVAGGLAAGVACLTALIPALGSDSDGGTDLTAQEAATVALATLVGLGGVGYATYKVPNKPL